MEYKFTTETIHDLTLHREFTQGYSNSNILRTVFGILLSGILIWYIFHFDQSLLLYMFLLIAAVKGICALIRHFSKGDIQYKRMLSMNDGQPGHTLVQFGEDKLTCINQRTGSDSFYGYDRFTSMIETKNLLILTMKYRLCLILEKRWLRGGTVEELKAFLLERCVNIKRKRVRKTTFGSWIQRLVALILILGTLIALGRLTGIFDKHTAEIGSDAGYRQIAQELEEFQIHVSEDTITQLEQYETEFDDYFDEYPPESYERNRVLDLLCFEGMGKYDYETWEWTPSTSGVYWFDTEVMNVESMYTDFLTGVSAMNDELAFTNVYEDYRGADLDRGIGMVSIQFDWQGETYHIRAEYDYDWFDSTVLDKLCSIIRNDGTGKQLYYAFDGGQGLLLYYAEPDTAAAFEWKTGIYFTDSHFLFF